MRGESFVATAIEFNHYEKKLAGRKVLQDICLSVEEGSITWIVGPNGCGKTMLLRAAAGLIRPDNGSVRVFGQQLSMQHRFPESVGIVLEHPSLWDDLTGLETLKSLAAIRKQATESDCVQALKRVGLDPEDRRTVRKYSLGMKQRLCIAQAIMEKPKLLLLDEPLNALDKEAVEQMSVLLREEQERNATIVIASHIESRLETMCDATVFLAEGKITEIQKKEM